MPGESQDKDKALSQAASFLVVEYLDYFVIRKQGRYC